MSPLQTSAFDLHDHPAKADPALIERDEQHFAALAQSLDETIADLTRRIEAERLAPGGTGQEAMDRDLEIHRLTARLRALRRFTLDVCLGRVVADGEPDPVYIGRFGLTDRHGRRLLVDWRSPAAEPFFAATHAHPMGLASRRRYRWARGRVTDYWEEVFAPDGLEGHAALDDQSAFIASLGGARSGRMRDVLGTIQADQDAIVRAGSRGALVVDGGPGTGKTVVALHRAAYLLYSDPHVGESRGGVLVVGPHQPYLAYVADVLPGLGEEGVQTCTLRDLLPEGATAPDEPDPEVARLKARADMVRAIEPAVRLYEEPPTEGLEVEHPWGDVWLERRRLGRGLRVAGAGAVAQRGPRRGLGGAAHDPRGQARARPGRPERLRGPGTTRARGPRRAARRLRPGLATDRPDRPGRRPVVRAGLPPRCARRGSSPTRCGSCSGPDPQAWTSSDLPLLDAARQRLGDPEASRRRRRRQAAAAADREQMSQVVDHLIATDDSDMHVMSMLRGQDLQAALADDDVRPRTVRGPARRAVRSRHRGRGAGADRRRVADAAAPLPFRAASPSSATGPRPGTGSRSRGSNG